MWLTKKVLLRRSCVNRLVVAPGPISSSESAQTKGFYSSFTYGDELKQVDVPDLRVQLLPFQKEGVGWMAQRELTHVGGIMADHLGMGKTIQMIGLCLISDNLSKLIRSHVNTKRRSVAEGNRLLTVIRQMLRISVVSSCSKINRPGEDLRSLMITLENIIQKQKHNYSKIRSEVNKWLQFTAKFHPLYAKRAVAFLNDEEKRDFALIESKELRTLVVVPASLMLQWKSEIETKIKDERKISVFLYHGGSKNVSATELESHDFVITTYDTLTYSAAEAFVPGEDSQSYGFNRKLAGPIFHIFWKRIILDEAHMIRHSRTNRWRAIKELRGLHRWAVTATPLHNSIDDIQNLLFFVGLPRLPVVPGISPTELLNDMVLQRSIAHSLQPAFLRRGPVMMRNGVKEVLVQLPPKTEMVVHRPFTAEESNNYNSILARSRGALATSERKEGGTFHVFAMMTRLRQACCHPWISEGKAVEVSICGICNAEATAAVKTKCGHSFCHECLLVRFRDELGGDQLATKLPCPTCEVTVTFSSVFKKLIMTSAERIALFKSRTFQLSTKITMIIDAVQEMTRKSPNDKMIIFSQFTSFMDVISVALDRLSIEHLRLDGTMSLAARNTTMRSFHSSAHIKVILASKTSTGVGLNLTAANHVLIVDPWWNPAIEEQAVHRCYRIGQKKPVHVFRFIISDTIEQYCFEICQKKKEFGDAILKAATSGQSGAKVAASKLEELIGRLKFSQEFREGYFCVKHSRPLYFTFFHFFGAELLITYLDNALDSISKKLTSIPPSFLSH
eukprot:gene8347-5846_t